MVLCFCLGLCETASLASPPTCGLTGSPHCNRLFHEALCRDMKTLLVRAGTGCEGYRERQGSCSYHWNSKALFGLLLLLLLKIDSFLIHYPVYCSLPLLFSVLLHLPPFWIHLPLLFLHRKMLRKSF